MRRLSYRDGFAALLLAAVAIPYVGYLIRGEMPFIQDPVGMAAVGITGLVLSYLAWGIETHSTFGKVMLVAGLGGARHRYRGCTCRGRRKRSVAGDLHGRLRGHLRGRDRLPRRVRTT
jgi:hypothetical protein